MTDKETAWDKILQIKTIGRDDTNADEYRFPYEPTPYCVLERLEQSGLFGKDNVLLDYGCGKGRVGFYLSHRTRLKAIGIEYDERIYRMAMENKKTASQKTNVELLNVKAEEYEPSENVDRIYFFNPFSLEILQKVMPKLINSYYASPREILLFFYYPSDEYMCYLMTLDELDFYDELDLDDLFDTNDARERIMIFKIG
jgi:16S rRNA G966 N2-methylase RsmD